MLAAIIGLYVASVRAARPGTTAPSCSASWSELHIEPDHAEVAVPRVLHRVRDQGAAVAVPHLAARRRAPRPRPAPRCCWSACSTRSARSACCASACRCSRTPEVLHPAGLMLAVVGIMYGALVAIGQSDMKRLIAYTSISHFGFITLGIFAMTTQGQSGRDALHGQPRLLHRRAVPRRRIPDRPPRVDRIADYGGVQKVAPLLAGLFLIAGLAALALPGLSTFVSEFLVLVGTFTRYPVYADHRHRRDRAGRDLHPVDVPADHDTARSARGHRASRDLRPRELLAVAPLVGAADRRRSGSSPSRCSTSSTRRSR